MFDVSCQLLVVNTVQLAPAPPERGVRVDKAREETAYSTS